MNSPVKAVGVALAFVLVFALVTWALSPSDDFEFVAADDVGNDPFVNDAASPVPIEFVDLRDTLDEAAEEAEQSIEADEYEDISVQNVDAAKARQTAVIQTAEQSGLDVIQPGSSNGVGLYGGTGENVCDVEAIVEFFNSNPQITTEWAAVQKIDVSEVGAYLSSLTAGYLLDDHQVVNHTLKNGSAEPFDATLEAGTAVLVDDQGIPRVRCKCGNPLLSVDKPTVIDGRTVDGTAFADRVVTARIGADVPESDVQISKFFGNDPSLSLGAPDDRAVGLGDDPYLEENPTPERCELFLLLEFVDNRLVDGPGDDLKIVELGRAEPSYVSVGTSAEDLRLVGEVSGGVTSFDVSEVVDEGEEISHVRICDGPDNTSDFPGSDIDAVAALNSVPK